MDWPSYWIRSVSRPSVRAGDRDRQGTRTMSLWTKYKERVHHQHGWEVELRCPEYKYESLAPIRQLDADRRHRVR